MIQFRDFAPADITPTLAFSRRYESTTDVVARANAWIAAESIAVLSVETLLVPASVFEKSENRFTDNIQFDLGGVELGTPRIQMIRVWHQTKGGA